jgi:hypothetical protein
MARFDSLDLIYQTLYSELVQRSLDESFTSEFSSAGRFVAVSVKGKKYWYFDTPKQGGGQNRRYVGPQDDPDLTSRVEVFKDLKADIRGRRRLVSTLTREAYLPRPQLKTGQVVEELANAGFFRSRGVLIGTVAYQCYSAVLGRRLDATTTQTGDADFVQFREGKAVQMPPLGAAAAFPLRFLEYLIYQPIRAVLLHGAGVPVLIPPPERYAVHKLIVGSRRKKDRDATAKSIKDRLQSRSIFEAMIRNRQHAEMGLAFMEAWDRGEAWKDAIRKSIASYDDEFRARLQKELARGVTESGADPIKYGLEFAAIDASAKLKA